MRRKRRGNLLNFLLALVLTVAAVLMLSSLTAPRAEAQKISVIEEESGEAAGISAPERDDTPPLWKSLLAFSGLIILLGMLIARGYRSYRDKAAQRRVNRKIHYRERPLRGR